MRIDRRTLVGGLAAYLVLRAGLLATPGYEHDLRAYKRWAVAAASAGLSAVYREADMDYPPLYAYLLAPLGRVYLELLPSSAPERPRGDPALWTALAKLPPLAFDLAIAALLFGLGRRQVAGSAWPVLLPAAYLLDPAVLFDTGYWGHPDSVHAFFVLAAFVALESRPAAAFALLALGSLMKPLAAPFFPLLLALAVRRHGLRGGLRGLAAALAAALAVFAPFLASGEAGAVVRRVALDLDRMPFTSVNAHNLWWLLGPWRDSRAPLVGPLSASAVGLALFGLVYAALLRLSWQTRPGGTAASLGLASAVGFSFFLLSTHMHENHLFTVVPLLAALLPEGRRWRWAFAAASLALLLNLVLHDPVLPGRWPLTLGGPTGLARPSHGRTFFAAELWATYAAAVLTLACGAWLLGGVLRPGPASWLAGRRDGGAGSLRDGGRPI